MKTINKSVLITALKAINTFYSKSINNLIYENNLNQCKNNIEIIHRKNINDLKHYNNVNDKVIKKGLIDFILSIANKENIKINKSEYKTLLNNKNIVLNDFNNYAEFAAYCNDRPMSFKIMNDSKIFNVNNILSSIITFLIVENTLLNIDTNTRYFNLVKNIILSTDRYFWINGYYKDLLVHDRIANYNNSAYKYIICMAGYCSTSISDSIDGINNIKKHSCNMYHDGNIYTI